MSLVLDMDTRTLKTQKHASSKQSITGGSIKTQQFERCDTRFGTSIHHLPHKDRIQYYVPTQKKEATLGHVNWGVVYPESSYKITHCSPALY